MTTITIERALLEQAYAMLSSNKTHIRVVMSRDETCVAIRAALAAPATAPERKPMTDEAVIDLVEECGLDWHKGFMPLFDDDPTNRFAVLVRAVEASHDIKDAP